MQSSFFSPPLSSHFFHLLDLLHIKMPIISPTTMIIITIFSLLLWKWIQHINKRRLPPGSMGWPYFGETFMLHAQNPNNFFSQRCNRYGNIFKSHILGCPCVMISCPEAAKNVLVSQAHLFKPTYPLSKMKLIGPEALFFHQGGYHSMLKRLIQTSFSLSAIKASVPAVENIVLNFLPKWENATGPIYTLQEMKRYAFEVAMISVFGEKLEEESEGIKCLYRRLEKGYNSMPLDFPGTRFHRAMKARKSLNQRLMKLIEKRRGNGEAGAGLLGIMLGAQKQKLMSELSDFQIADNIIGVIFAAHDTTASVLTWVLKYLHDNVSILEAVVREQEGVRRKLEEEDKRGLTWDDCTRHMSLTSRVIQETLRSASILSFTYREAVEDVEFEDYVIPKGWKVLPLFRTIHHSSDFFNQPEIFNPSRFEVAPKPNTFIPFGNGAHSCPGSELAKLEMLIFLHHLTTTYRWNIIGADNAIQYGPFPVPEGGLPIQVNRRGHNST